MSEANAFGALFIITAILVVLELVASLFWMRFFWRLGLPLFRTSRTVAFGSTLPSPADIQASQPESAAPPFAFRRFEDGSIAFRESYRFGVMKFGFNYTPLMRGLITFDPLTSSVQVRGYAYWWLLAFAGVFITMTGYPLAVSEGDRFAMVMTGFVVALFVFLYLVQLFRFRRVANGVAEMMSPSLGAQDRVSS